MLHMEIVSRHVMLTVSQYIGFTKNHNYNRPAIIFDVEAFVTYYYYS